MPTILDRLLGRTDSAQKAVITGNGGTGPGVLAWQNDTHLWSASKNPRRLMRQAQELYHRDLIIRAAEHRVSSAASGLPWHLEDENHDEITDEHPDAQAKAIRDWLEKPQAALTDRRQMTRRALWQLTSRHSGLCGTAFWFLDQRTLLTGVPMVALYINPARMYPVQNEQGILLGWKLDSDEEGNGGVPIELDEVLQFDFEPPDWGHYGIGLVESGGSTAALASTIERHEAGVFAAGARLAGLIAPKVGVQISDDQWVQTARDWRNITSDPESAKRLHILRGAVDYTRTAATMQELQVEHISKMAREDKLALWGVPQSQLPLPAPAGLNSGETKGFDEAVFYQGAVHDRILVLYETIQYQLLDRIAAGGGPKLELVIEEPAFDNEMPMYERADKASGQPLTVNERRAILMLDPLPDVDRNGEPLGTAIYLPINLSLVGSGPDENGNPVALPEPDPQPVPVAPPVEVEEETKAAPLSAFRRKVETTYVPKTKTSVHKALQAQAKEIAGKVRAQGAHLSRKPTDQRIWWNASREDKRLRDVLEPANLRLAQTVTGQVSSLIPKKADGFVDNVLDYIRRQTGERIANINETTRESIAKLIVDGFTSGLGPSEVADSIEAATAFTESRAELVARTETMLAYNSASLRSFEEFGVTEVEAIDGDEDDECAERNGQVFPIEEALAIEDHPNGTLDWAPVIA